MSTFQDTYFQARYALTADGWLENAVIRVNDERIQSVSRSDNAYDSLPRRYDCNILVPGAINVHSHSFQRKLKGRTGRFLQPDDDFWSWRELMYEEALGMRPHSLHAITAELYSRMKKAGYTTVCEFHYVHGAHLDDGIPLQMGQAIQAAARDVGIRLVLLPVLYRFSGFGARPPKNQQLPFVLEPGDYLDLCNGLSDGYGTLGYAPHSLRAVQESDIRAILRHRSQNRPTAVIHIHAAEQMREVNECIITHGSRPVQFLLDRFSPDSSWCIVHATHTEQHELTALAQSGATVGLCPTTEADLGDGHFPLRPYVAANGRFAVGSDSNVCTDVTEELRFLDYQNRLETRRRNAFQLRSNQPVGTFLLRHMLDGGRCASGLDVGKLESGNYADMLDLSGSEDPDEVVGAWISGDTSRLSQVYVGGKR